MTEDEKFRFATLNAENESMEDNTLEMHEYTVNLDNQVINNSVSDLLFFTGKLNTAVTDLMNIAAAAATVTTNATAATENNAANAYYSTATEAAETAVVAARAAAAAAKVATNAAKNAAAATESARLEVAQS